MVKAILGADWEDEAMYRRALAAVQREAKENTEDAYAWFNLGDDHLALGEYEEAAQAYELALGIGFPSHFLWYQYGPLEAYNALGEYEKTVALSAEVLATVSDIEEIRYQRGLAYLGLGEKEKARAEFELALKYNPNFSQAKEALEGI